jgi:hypothetical protein
MGCSNQDAPCLSGLRMGCGGSSVSVARAVGFLQVARGVGEQGTLSSKDQLATYKTKQRG